MPDLTFNFETGEYEGGGGGFFGIAMILSLLFGALSFVVNLVVQSGIIKASLALTRGQKIDFGTAFSGINWGQVVIAALIIGVLTFVGLILCILPGIAGHLLHVVHAVLRDRPRPGRGDRDQVQLHAWSRTTSAC